MFVLLQASQRRRGRLSCSLRQKIFRHIGCSATTLLAGGLEGACQTGCAFANDNRGGSAEAFYVSRQSRSHQPETHDCRRVWQLHFEAAGGALLQPSRKRRFEHALGGNRGACNGAALADALCRRRALLHNKANRPRRERRKIPHGGHGAAYFAPERRQIQVVLRTHCKNSPRIFRQRRV